MASMVSATFSRASCFLFFHFWNECLSLNRLWWLLSCVGPELYLLLLFINFTVYNILNGDSEAKSDALVVGPGLALGISPRPARPRRGLVLGCWVLVSHRQKAPFLLWLPEDDFQTCPSKYLLYILIPFRFCHPVRNVSTFEMTYRFGFPLILTVNWKGCVCICGVCVVCVCVSVCVHRYITHMGG